MVKIQKFGKLFYVCHKRITEENPSMDTDESHIVDGPFNSADEAYQPMIQAYLLYDDCE